MLEIVWKKLLWVFLSVINFIKQKPLLKKQNTMQNTGIYANTDCRL